MTQYDVVALGELLIDFVQNGIDNLENPSFTAHPGGAPCNVLAMLQGLGHATAFIGKVGRDQFGQQLQDAIRRVGIADRGLVFDPEIPTTLAFVHHDHRGDRDFTFYRSPGADLMLREEEIDWTLFQEARVFHIGSLSMTTPAIYQVTQKALDRAQAAGLMISFDPNLREPLWRDLAEARERILATIPKCDLVKLSREELVFLTSQTELALGIDALRQLNPHALICVTDGDQGAYADHGQGLVYVPAVKVMRCLDTTGAGDAFWGGALHYLLDQGWDLATGLSLQQLQALLTYANAGASIVVQRVGALEQMPSAEEIQTVLEREA